MKRYIIVWIAALAAIACGLLVCESHTLWKVQELNLFLPTALFFKEQMVVPAGMLTYVGTWFTQFFYHPWLGVTMLCGWWLLLLVLLKKTFAVPDRWAPLLLIPVALLLLTDVDLGYWVYILKLRGHFFLTTIGTASVVALLWAFRSLPDRYGLRVVLIVLTGLAGYPLLGIYGLAATLLMGLWSWRLVPRRRAILYSIIAVLTAVAVPLLCCRYVYHETNPANIYYAGLPLFFVSERYPQYYIPYILLALFMVVIVCVKLGVNESTGQRVNGSTSQRVNKPKGRKVSLSSLILYPSLLLLVGGVVAFWYKDENFHHEVKMQHFIEQTDWKGVLQEAAKQKDEPTRAIVMMRNLALSRLGRQGEVMYHYRNGSKRYDAPFDMRLMMVCGTLVYYQYGMLNYCNRLCTEMGVEFGWRAEHYKYMIRCALLNGEENVARKYIRILKRTLFFDDWAARAEALLDNPERIAQDREMEPVTHMLHYTDVAGGDQGYVERFLMNQLAKTSYSKDPVFQEQSLLASLWVKDPKYFWHHFYIYVSQHPDGPIPVAYQEAAYLFSKMEDRQNIDQMPFSQGVKDSFNRFYQFISRCEGMNIDDVRKQMGRLYSNTFYYDYELMSKLPEY